MFVVGLPLLLLLQPAAGALPAFSWSTLPVFWHACNFSGTLSEPFNGAVAEWVATHSYASATVEKGQGLNGGDAGSFAEQRIVAALRQLKAAAAAVPDRMLATVAYFNSVLDWQYYQLHADMVAHPSWAVRNDSGAPVRIHGDPHFPQPAAGMLVFDFAQAPVRDWFAGACAALVAGGDVDGCFQDRAGPPTLPGVRNASAYNAGHDSVLRDMQARLPDGFVVANAHIPSGTPSVRATMIEFFSADNTSITALRDFASVGLIVHAHAYSSSCAGRNAAFTSFVAAFLIGAGEGSYFGCSLGWQIDPRWPAPSADNDWMHWPSEYDAPLGAPCGDAVLLGDRWTRAFGATCATHVAFNIKSGQGTIAWAT